MSANASSSSSPFTSSHCFIATAGSTIAFSVTNILLLLPLCTFILHHGFREWRKKRSSSSSSASMSHSNVFTYHMVAMELFRVSACFLCCFGIPMRDFSILLVGTCLMFLTWYGETVFHVLTCVERYLAVVHPVAYLRLRSERGVRIRNATIGCVWLFCVGQLGLFFEEDIITLVNFTLIAVSLIVVFFCSVSVLRVLIRPGPGEGGGTRERVDQSKQRAFYTIVAILGALLLRFCCYVGWGVLTFTGRYACQSLTIGMWLSLPSSLVLPLLFLHREFKMVCCK